MQLFRDALGLAECRKFHSLFNDRTLDNLGIVGKDAVVRAIPNGVTVGQLGPPGPMPAGAPRVVVLGRIHPVKNLELAIESLAALRVQPGFEQATLALVGLSLAGMAAQRRRRTA